VIKFFRDSAWVGFPRFRVGDFPEAWFRLFLARVLLFESFQELKLSLSFKASPPIKGASPEESLKKEAEG